MITMVSERVVRVVTDYVIVYGIPIVVVALMVLVVNVYSPLMNAAPPAIPQPIIQYFKYEIYDNNSTIVLYFNTKNIEFIGIQNTSLSISGKKITPLRTSFRADKLFIEVEPRVLKYACIEGKYIDISFTGLVHYLNSTALFKSYGIRIVYSCHIRVSVKDMGTYIMVSVEGPSWIISEGFGMNISVRLYSRSPTGAIKLVDNTSISIVYSGIPVIVPVEPHSFGYVFVEYMQNGRKVREGFYVEPEK